MFIQKVTNFSKSSQFANYQNLEEKKSTDKKGKDISFTITGEKHETKKESMASGS